MRWEDITLSQKLSFLVHDWELRHNLKLTVTQLHQRFVHVTGSRIALRYFSYLLDGKKNNPRAEILESLAKFFEVDIKFFSTSEPDDEKGKAKAQLVLLDLVNKHGIDEIAARSAELSSTEIQFVSKQIQRVLSMTSEEIRQEHQRALESLHLSDDDIF